MKVKAVAGEGPTARDALEGLAFSVSDEEIDEMGTMTIELKRAKVRELGGEETYDGFIAEVVR